MAEVKCVDCGFLALRDWQTRELAEVEAGIRETGNIPTRMIDRQGQQPLYEPEPLCFRRVYDLVAESKRIEAPPNSRLLQVITKPRECDQSIPWQQGLTPMEHFQMMQGDIDRQWREAEAEKQRLWQEKQAEVAERRHRESIEIAKRSSDDNWRSTIYAAIIGGAVALFVGWLSLIAISK